MKEVNCLGMRCPLPIIEIGRQIKAVGPGESILLYSDDPATEVDLNAWGRMTGNQVKAVNTHQYLVTKTKVQ